MTTFKDLPIGARFEFASVRTMPNSGMARGPWIKTSARKYKRESDGMACKVGAINTEVDLVAPATPLPTLSLGTISHATLREQDLIPSFVSALEDLNDSITTNAPADFDSQREHVETSKRITDLLATIEANQREYTPDLEDLDDDSEYWTSEDAGWDLEALQDMLNEFVPAHCYFGAHEGDGSDFGVWVSWDSLEEDCRSGEVLKVSDLSEVEEGYTGEVLHVNDHGNGTLYQFDHGQSREIWAVV